MSDTTVAAPPSSAPRPASGPLHADLGDERLAYRGIFQRLFIRPEIGALIGVVGLWVFFWAVAIPFGTANGASNIIDFASSPLGIMAVAVSMLMVGGEFDLSAGAMTGAMGILVVMFSKSTAGEFGGLGLNLWIAIPLSLAVALGIGYMNGWLVERTRLPSFTITLGTYYVLWGAKLGFSKLIVDQVQVGDIRDASGHSFWVKVFASSWDRNEHTFDSRDKVYFVCLMLAIALTVLAAVEMQFTRREAAKASGLPTFLAGLAGVVAGIAVLHTTDGVSGNWLGAAIIAGGVLVGLYGYSVWRFEPIADRGEIAISPRVSKLLGVGLVGVAIAILVAWRMDAYNEEEFFFPFTKQGFRATLFLAFGAAGFVALLMAQTAARRINVATRAAVGVIIALTLAAVAFFIRWESKGDPSNPDSIGSVKFRSEAFSVMLGIALFMLVWSLLSLLFEERQRIDQRSDLLGRQMLVAAGVLATIGMVVKLMFTVPREIEAGLAPANFSVRTLWFIGFTIAAVLVLGKTRFGSWTFAVGGNKEASRQVGVPAARTKTQLFMLVSGAAWLAGMLLAFRLNTIQANTGNGEEFDYIIAAVVGGTLLTGGYGTALGGALGAVIVSIATLGIPFARWNSDWSKLFLGVILLLAMLANRSIRTRAEGTRR
jgi:ribose/xylose/arabinose/galactoside ABC-type transport system permease subunit